MGAVAGAGGLPRIAVLSGLSREFLCAEFTRTQGIVGHNGVMVADGREIKRAYCVYVIELDRAVMEIAKFRDANPGARSFCG